METSVSVCCVPVVNTVRDNNRNQLPKLLQKKTANNFIGL